MDTTLQEQLKTGWKVANTHTVYSDKPHRCPECNGMPIFAMNLPGTDVDYLFWECQQCDIRLLAYPPDKTQALLDKVYGLFVNPLEYPKEFE